MRTIIRLLLFLGCLSPLSASAALFTQSYTTTVAGVGDVTWETVVDTTTREVLYNYSFDSTFPDYEQLTIAQRGFPLSAIDDRFNYRPISPLATQFITLEATYIDPDTGHLVLESDLEIEYNFGRAGGPPRAPLENYISLHYTSDFMFTGFEGPFLDAVYDGDNGRGKLSVYGGGGEYTYGIYTPVISTIVAAPVPEPSGYLLFGVGLLGMMVNRHRHK